MSARVGPALDVDRFAADVRATITRWGMNACALADLARVNQATIYNLFRGRSPSPATAEKIAAACDLDLSGYQS